MATILVKNLTDKELGKTLSVYRERFNKFHKGEYDLSDDLNSELVMMSNYNSLLNEMYRRVGIMI